MNFAEKLCVLRKKLGFTQELLAEKLHVSRQAVAKWETALAYPDIDNLIQLSNLLHVTIDYLIKEQECSICLEKADTDDTEKIILFRLKAAAHTYAGQMNAAEATRLDSHDFSFEEGEFTYHDSYVGGEQFAGEEAIWKDGRSVYAMNYMGRVLGSTFSGDFLKEALRAADITMPYRGPEYYQAGEYIYKCKVTGDVAWFQGEEEIFCSGEKVYECRFHGGLIYG